MIIKRNWINKKSVQLRPPNCSWNSEWITWPKILKKTPRTAIKLLQAELLKLHKKATLKIEVKFTLYRKILIEKAVRVLSLKILQPVEILPKKLIFISQVQSTISDRTFNFLLNIKHNSQINKIMLVPKIRIAPNPSTQIEGKAVGPILGKEKISYKKIKK